MEGSNKEKMLTALLGAFAAAVLAITVWEVLVKGPLRPVLRDELTLRMMAEVLLVFLWNLFCLGGTGKKGLRVLGLTGGIILFTWCHSIFLPLVVSGLYMAGLMLAGRMVLGLFLGGLKLPKAEEASISLVLGNALWMVTVCLVSLTGRGGLDLWRRLAALMALAAVSGGIWRIRRRRKEEKDREKDQAQDREKDREKDQDRDAWSWFPQNKVQACLTAFIITMVLIQAGRMNIELDYDSLHYGLRSAYVLDNGRGIYEDLGMINLVYTYSKGLEVLALPLSGTPTYGFVLSFSLWCTLGIIFLAGHMVGRYGGRDRGMWAAAAIAAIPGIMNMAATAKCDSITLLHQLIIYDCICLALGSEKIKRGPGKDKASGPAVPWLLMAVGTYLLTLVYKPTALVFSTALGGVALLCLIAGRRFTFGAKRGWLLLILPGAATAGLWYRTWLLTGVPVTSIFAGMFQKAGCRVKYPFSFTHVIGDPSALPPGDKLVRLAARLWGILLAPVSQDMAHVIIAWGTGLVTVFIFLWVMTAWGLGRGGRKDPLNRFDCILLPVLALGSIVSIYTLSQVDGNYFILFYALLVVSALRMGSCGTGRPWLKKAPLLVMIPFFAVNTVFTCATGWAGTPGFTPVSVRHKGYYDHRGEAAQRRILEGNLTLASMFTPRSRVLAFGEHPKVLDLPCSVQSYYDVSGSGGNVYLVKRMAYFERFLEYAGTEYIFVEAGYLAGQPRALEIIRDMIEEGSLSDIRYEWGNMAARVTLNAPPPEDPEGALREFGESYSMTANN